LESDIASSNGGARIRWIILEAAIIIGVLAFLYGIYQQKTTIQGDKYFKSNQRSSGLNGDNLEEQFTKLSKVKMAQKVQEGWLNIVKSISTIYIDDIQTNLSSAISNAVARRKPTLMKDCTFIRNSWQIMNWDLLQLARSKNISLNATRWKPDDPIFVLGQERDKGGMIGSRRDHPVMFANLTLFKFLKATFAPNNWLYWTGELSLLEEQVEMSATVPSDMYKESDDELIQDGWKAFRILENGISNIESGSKSNNSRDDSSLWTPMLWLSHPGVVAHTHYDTQHNMFIQIHGTKRFLLFPPTEELFSYPNIHRSYRQSQLHFEEPHINFTTRLGSFVHAFKPIHSEGSIQLEFDSHASHSFSYPVVNGSQSAMEVLLQPGDVLYIPPYWQHRVESLTLSLSLSILSPSHLEAAFAEIYWESVPFGDFKVSKEARATGVKWFLTLLIDKLILKKVLSSSNNTLQFVQVHLLI